MQKILGVVGPTASGKTKLSIELAKAFNGEIISCDSMQIYRGMEIGTAAPTREEMQGIVHHMVGVMDPTEEFSCADYAQRARAVIDEVTARGKVNHGIPRTLSDFLKKLLFCTCILDFCSYIKLVNDN